METVMETLTAIELKPVSVSEPRELRNLMGQFATGVTIITTVAADGTPVGLTANSFSSVSLNPALVLWSLDKRSPNIELFRHNSHFAINILAASQHELSSQFARPADDKFADVDYQLTDSGTVVLDGALVSLVCRNACQYEGGDHLIFIGEIEQFASRAGEPLVFHGGQYRTVSRHPAYS